MTADAEVRLPGRSRRRWVTALLFGLTVLAIAVWAVRRRTSEPGAARPRPSRLQPEGDEVAVVLDTAARRWAGIETRRLAAATLGATGLSGGNTASDEMRADAVESPGGGSGPLLTGELIADPGRVTTMRPAVPGRLVAPGGRWPALGERIAAGTVVAQVSDALPLVAPRGGTVTRVAAQPGELVQAGQELLQLTDFGELLARIVWRADAPVPPATIRLAPLTGVAGSADGVAGIPARLVGPAAEVDSLTRAPVYLYRVRGGWTGARPGLPITAVIPIPALTGPDGRAAPGADAAPGTSDAGADTRLLVPADAVVQWDGLAWAFVERTPGRFVRLRVDTREPVGGGWMVRGADRPTPGVLALGNTVVVRGAQQLLSAEFSSRLPQDAAAER